MHLFVYLHFFPLRNHITAKSLVDTPYSEQASLFYNLLQHLQIYTSTELSFVLQFVKMAKKAFLVEELYDEDRPVFSRERLFLFSFRSRKAKGPVAQASRGEHAVEERKQAGLDTAAALGVKVKI